jgi:hypothetical protein
MPDFALPLLAVALASAAAGAWWLARRGAAVSGGYLGLLVVGQAALLQLAEAGPRVAYQHLRPLSRMWAERPAALAFLALQSVVVLAGLWRHRAAFATLLRAVPRRAGLGFCALALILGSATLSRSPATYVAELVSASLCQAIALGTVVLALLALPGAAADGIAAVIDRILGDPAGEALVDAPAVDRFAAVLAIWVTLVAVILNRVAYQGHPHVPDEVAYLFHAKYFAKGLLWLPPPRVPAAFDIDLLTLEPTRWFSPVPPGWPAMLAVGEWLGVPSLVNPLLAGLNVLLAYLLLLELYDRRTARTALLLLALSPWHLFLAMSYMNHTFTFTAALIAALGIARSRRGARVAWPLAAGAGAGVVGLIRPLEGMIVAVLLGLWALAPRQRRWDLIPAIAFSVGTLVVGGLVFPYNKALTGDPKVFPIMQYTDSHYGPGTNALGFGANRGLGWGGLDPLPGHGPLDVLINANLNGTSVNLELLGWATGSLLPLALLLFLMPWRRGDRFMLAMIGGVVGMHSFYWFSGGPDFGARYWYLILLPCVGLAASAITRIDRSAMGGGRAILAALALAWSALFTFLPWRAADKYYHYRGMRPDIRTLARTRDFGASLVLVRGNRHPDYHSAAIYNPLDLDAPQPIYAWDRDSTTRAAVLRAYPRRPVWYVDGPTVTGDGYRIVAGPFPNNASP